MERLVRPTRRDLIKVGVGVGATTGLGALGWSSAWAQTPSGSIRAIMHKVHQDMQVSVLPQLESEGLTVNITTGPIAQVEEAFVREARLQPSGFDVGFQKPEWYDEPRFDLLEPLNAFQEQQPIADFGDVLPSLVAAGSFKGKQLMMPVRTGAYVIHNRKDLFAENGIASPTSIEELGEAARALHSKLNIYGFTCYGRADAQWQVLHNLTAAFGGRLFDEAGEPSLNGAGTVAALDWYASLFKDGVISPDHLVMDVDGVNRLIMEGRTAMLMDLGSRWSVYTDPSVSKVAGKLGWWVLPPAEAMKGQEIGGYASTWSMVIPKTSEHKDLAWNYVSTLMRPDVQITMAQQGNDPVRQSTWQSKELLAKYAERDASELPAVTQAALERATSPWPNGLTGTAKITEIIGEAVHRAMLGTSSQDALNEAAEKIRALRS